MVKIYPFDLTQNQGVMRAICETMVQPIEALVCAVCGRELVLEQSEKRTRIFCYHCQVQIELPPFDALVKYVLRRAFMLARARPTCESCQWLGDRLQSLEEAGTQRFTCPYDPASALRVPQCDCCPHHQDAYTWRPPETEASKHAPGTEPWEA